MSALPAPNPLTLSAMAPGAPIQGGLNVSNAGGNLFQGAGNLIQNPAGALNQFAGNYSSAYNAALQANQQQYNSVLQGYQQLGQQQQQSQQGQLQGYNQLQQNVLSGIQGIGQSQSQQIAKEYAQLSGQTQQANINNGLANSTVQASQQLGNLNQETQAQTGLANQIAALNAGYQSNLGLAGLNYQNQATQQNTALGAQQLGFMQNTNIPYPNAQTYGGLISGALGVQAGQYQRGAQPQAVVNPFGSGASPNSGINRPFAQQSPSPSSPGSLPGGGQGSGFGSPYIPGSARPGGGQYGTPMAGQTTDQYGNVYDAQGNLVDTPGYITPGGGYDTGGVVGQGGAPGGQLPTQAQMAGYNEPAAGSVSGSAFGSPGYGASGQSSSAGNQYGGQVAQQLGYAFGQDTIVDPSGNILDSQGNPLGQMDPYGGVYDSSGNYLGGFDSSGSFSTGGE